jgi:hypothetical protein
MGLFRWLFPSPTAVGELQRRVTRLETEVDLVALERTHADVLKALRALRRAQQAQDVREAAPEPSNGSDSITAAIHARRARGILPGR